MSDGSGCVCRRLQRPDCIDAGQHGKAATSKAEELAPTFVGGAIDDSGKSFGDDDAIFAIRSVTCLRCEKFFHYLHPGSLSSQRIRAR
jgi:hypothetical protein